MSTCKDASGFPGGASAGDMRDAGSIPGSGRSPGGRHGNPFQHSCLENVMDRGAWWATVHSFAKSQTWLSVWTELNDLNDLKHPCVSAKLLQSCLPLCKSMDCSLPGSSVHDILQERILECVVMPSSNRSSQPRDQTQVSHITGRFYTRWATGEAPQFDCVDHIKLWKILQEMRIPDHLTCLLRNLYADQEATVRTGHE